MGPQRRRFSREFKLEAVRLITEQDIVRVMVAADKRRFELRDAKVRALYSRSTSQS